MWKNRTLVVDSLCTGQYELATLPANNSWSNILLAVRPR